MIGIESTIIKFDSENNVSILRPGFVTVSNLRLILGNDINVTTNIKYKNNNQMPDSSGQFIKHYAINCHTMMIKVSRKIRLEELPIKDNIAIIDIGSKKIKEDIAYYDNLSEHRNLKLALYSYYEKLRNFELFNKNNNIKVLYIIVDIRIKDDMYMSLVDRIYRTSSGNILNLT